MQKVPKVAAVCVNWNGGSALRAALESLQASDYPGLEILTVDNASSDDSLSNLPRDAEILQLKNNTGYGEALNRGIEYLEAKNRVTPADYYLVLNNDIILEPDTVSGLVKCAERRGPGIYGPAVVQESDPERLEAAWGTLTWSHVLTSLEGKSASASHPSYTQEKCDVILLGSIMLIHRSIIDAAIRFDPFYFMYHEEVDFIFEAGNRGFPSCYCPSIRARHLVGLGTRDVPLKKIYWTRRNTVYFLKKHGAGAGKWIKCLGSMTGSMFYAAIRLRFGRARAITEGLIDGLKGFSENQHSRGSIK